MKVQIRTERCKECGLCIHHCPKKAISFSTDVNKLGNHPITIDDEKCIGCGICYTTCPDGVCQLLGQEA